MCVYVCLYIASIKYKYVFYAPIHPQMGIVNYLLNSNWQYHILFPCVVCVCMCMWLTDWDQKKSDQLCQRLLLLDINNDGKLSFMELFQGMSYRCMHICYIHTYMCMYIILCICDLCVWCGSWMRSSNLVGFHLGHFLTVRDVCMYRYIDRTGSSGLFLCQATSVETLT